MTADQLDAWHSRATERAIRTYADAPDCPLARIDAAAESVDS